MRYIVCVRELWQSQRYGQNGENGDREQRCPAHGENCQTCMIRVVQRAIRKTASKEPWMQKLRDQVGSSTRSAASRGNFPDLAHMKVSIGDCRVRTNVLCFAVFDLRESVSACVAYAHLDV